jgi:putative PIN family toxin of toxin-antitoxin system
MRLVLDTDVVVAALRSPSGASAELLRLARYGEIKLCASVALFLEYEAVCMRTEHLIAAQLTEQQVAAVLNALASFIEPVDIHFYWRPQLRDAADELVLEAAVNAKVDALVTFNQKHFAAAVSRFNLSLLRPSDALKRFRDE